MSVEEQMREDWNRRAKEDAHYYVAFGRHEQDEEEFLSTASDVLRGLEREMKRGLPGTNPRARRALEIGCGPGRLMKPLSRIFGEIHGVDVSDEMIALATERLKPIPHAHPHVGSGADLRLFADDSFGLRLLALEAVKTQYMWVTIRKPGPEAASSGTPRIRRITNSESSEPVAPNRGRYSAVSLWIESLPVTADLLSLTLTVGGQPARLTYLSAPEMDGLVQLNAVLPKGLSTGLQAVELKLGDQLLAESGFRIIPAPPAVPRLVEAVDGLDYMSGTRIVSGSVKLFVEELFEPETLVASVDGVPAYDYSILCTDPMPPRHEINFRLPVSLGSGPKVLRLEAGRRLIGLVPIEIAPLVIPEVN